MFAITISLAQFQRPAKGMETSVAQVRIYDLSDPLTLEDLGLSPVAEPECPLWTEEDNR